MGRPLDEETVIEIVEYECGEWMGLAKEITKQIKALPSAEPQWIPCSERMPEENQICIVTDETMRNTYEYRFCKETYDENQGWTYLRHRIIAWMPLPEPYKENSNG